jgi:hypothetical protein
LLAEADDGYVGAASMHVKCLLSITNNVEREEFQSRVHSQQETVKQARFKKWVV